MSKVKTLKPLENFSGLSNADLVSRGTVVQTNMTGNAHFANPPVDLAALKTALDTLTALIAQALEGTKKVITGLTPATIYAFQARALVTNTFTDWSDSVTFIVT